MRVFILLFLSLAMACAGQTRQVDGPAKTGHTEIAEETGQNRPESFGFGRPASVQEIAAWDIDIMPDGTGLPPGQGTAALGQTIFAVKWATSCHGISGAEGPNDFLVRVSTDAYLVGQEPGWARTIGNYWPYPTTLFDYIRRAMPYNAPGSLTNEEVYSLTAYLLHLNELIPEDTVMNAELLPQVEMPSRNRFMPDDRRGGPEVR